MGKMFETYREPDFLGVMSAMTKVLTFLLLVWAGYVAFVVHPANLEAAGSAVHQQVVALWAIKDLLVALVFIVGLNVLDGVWSKTSKDKRLSDQ